MEMETNPEFFLVYVSSATTLPSPADLVDLLKQSRETNLKLGITGMLLYKDGSFMQVLEGEENAVRSLYNKIERDPRHRNLIILTQGALLKRQFQDWSMGFCNLNSEVAESLPGYSEFLNTALTDQAFFDNPTRCQKLLMVFKKTLS